MTLYRFIFWFIVVCTAYLVGSDVASPENLPLYDSTLLRIALDKGADVNNIDDKGDTALHRIGICSGSDVSVDQQIESFRCAKVLIERGANVNATNRSGNSPLQMLGFFSPDRTDIAELLINSGADCKIVDEGGKPLILYFMGHGKCNSSVVVLILKQYGDINAPLDSLNSTALHYAASDGCYNIVKYLLASGANPNLKNANGKTALQLVTESIEMREGIKRRCVPEPAKSDVGRALQQSAWQEGAELDASLRKIYDLLRNRSDRSYSVPANSDIDDR